MGGGNSHSSTVAQIASGLPARELEPSTVEIFKKKLLISLCIFLEYPSLLE